MATSSKSHTGARLGTRLRGKLAAAYSARGHHMSDLWYVYSPKTDRDWVLRSDLEWSHFLLAESDPTIKDIDYAPNPEIALVGDDYVGTTLDAVVTYIDGLIEWREIKPSDAVKNGDTRTRSQWEAQSETASRAGVRYVRFTEIEIFACPQLIENWTRVNAWLSAVRGRSLFAQQVEIVAILNVRGTVSIGEIQDLASPVDERACYVAAALKGVQNGQFVSDLREKPLSRRTVIKLAEGQP